MKTDETGRMVEFGEFPEFKTEHLVLRRMTPADAGFYLRHFSDPDIVELTAFDAPETIEKAMRNCSSSASNRSRRKRESAGASP